ncbi:MAG TPA: glycosyltransferase family 4 protein [Novosphingobium sp.]|nr:glycosyltransferase family 4 protein [Novosphingobium sp.]
MDTPAPDILFITRKWAPAVGGMETWSHRLSDSLSERAAVEVVALPGRPGGLPPTVPALLAFPLIALRRYLARDAAPDVLHIGDMALWPLGLLACLRRGSPAIVLTAHGTDVSYARRPGWRGRAYRAYQRLGARLLRRAHVTANSPATAAAAAEAGWRQVTVIPLATDLTGHVPDQPPQPHILFAGRLIPLKGCGWFIRSVLPLLPDGVTLKVAGTLLDPAEAAALDHPRVEYLGVLDQAALSAEYPRAACVVVPNIVPSNRTFEGFGLVAVEAAAAGGVTLAANCGGIPAAVIDGTTGILVESGDAAAWAEAIGAVLAWPLPRREAFLAGSLAAVESAFRWPRVAEATLAVYEQTRNDPSGL